MLASGSIPDSLKRIFLARKTNAAIISDAARAYTVHWEAVPAARCTSTVIDTAAELTVSICNSTASKVTATRRHIL
jgi:hypothetical protein